MTLVAVAAAATATAAAAAAAAVSVADVSAAAAADVPVAAAATASADAAAFCRAAGSRRVCSVLPSRHLVHPRCPGPRQQRGCAPSRSSYPSPEPSPFLRTR